MKKKMMTVLASLLIVTTVSACGMNNGNDGASEGGKVDPNVVVDPFGKYEQPVEVSIGRAIDPNYQFEDGQTAEDNIYTRWLSDTYNINVTHAWEASTEDYKQKVSLAIASNDLPDAMSVNETQLKQMIKSGQLADLSEVYEQFGGERLKAIYDSNPGLLDNVTYDGKLYAFPETTLPSAPLTWIRKDWLDQLGLEPPKTLEDLEKIAQAFIDNKMGGENTIGIVGTGQGGELHSTFLNSGDHFFNFSPLFFAHNAYPGIWVEGEDGKAVYGSTLPETKEAVAMMREWYQKGILDKEMALRKSPQEVVVSGQAGIFFGPWWSPYSIQDSIKNDPEANWRPYVAPVDDSGVYNSNQATGSTYIVVSKNYEHPEAIVKMLNIHVSEKDPSYEEVVADKQMTSQEIPLFIIAGHGDQLEYAVRSTQKHLKGEMALEDIDKLSYGFAYELALHAPSVKKEPFDNYDIQHWDKNGDEAFFTHVYAHLNGGSAFIEADINYVRSKVTSQTKTMESRWTNLKKLEDEMFLKMIMGSISMDEFDTFVEKWYDQGGEKITEEVNEIN
ncbi:extracellular solute-binding protein [Marinicrinis sediminis]|uniref:Extracellular solute-binding protein n=1 Tax=Marinicrinis sediminis TaxID=1652465 RepID=A0ABW5R984_9BACL